MKGLPDFKGKIVAGTGHRPDKLGGYTEAVDLRLYKLARDALSVSKPKQVISGVALGWDMALAHAAIRLNIPTIAAIPFEGQDDKWPEYQQARYKNILAKCLTVNIISPGGYAAWKMQVRNKWMVDNCDILLALWDGSEGGTGNCIEYALEHPHPPMVVNLWPEWDSIYCKQ